MTDEFTFDTEAPHSGEEMRDPQPEPEQPTTLFGSSDEFFRRFLRYNYRRSVGPPGRGEYRWRPDWWRSEEASCRIEAMWRSWEAARLDPVGMSTWWISVADPNMAQLLHAEGPFAMSAAKTKPGQPLPYMRPPRGMFPPDHQSDADFPGEPDEDEE